MSGPVKILRGLIISKEWHSERERTAGTIPVGHGQGDPDGSLRSGIFQRAGFEEGDRVALVLESETERAKAMEASLRRMADLVERQRQALEEGVLLLQSALGAEVTTARALLAEIDAAKAGG